LPVLVIDNAIGVDVNGAERDCEEDNGSDEDDAEAGEA